MKRFLASLLVATSLLATPVFADTSSDTVTVTFAGKTEEISIKKLGLRVISPEGNFLINLFRQQKNSYEWNEDRVTQVIYRTFDYSPAQNAYYTVEDDGSVSVVPEVDGYYFDADTLMEEISEDYPNFGTYEVEYVQPELMTAEALQVHAAQIGTLLNEGLIVEADGETMNFTAQLKDIFIIQEDDGIYLELDEPFMDFVINQLEERINREPEDLRIIEADPTDVSYVTTEGELIDGKTLLSGLSRSSIASVIKNGETYATAVVETEAAEIINETEHDLGPLSHISTGVSNYTGSDSGRTHNVEKAMNDHYDSILIPADAEFAFNEFLGPISTSAGWANAYIIVNGTDLKKSPGGGICQAATTMYRAALSAGMEITSRRNHSMYVSYYATPGILDTNTYDGLDATIYKGSQDLKFQNNTGHPILVRAFTTEDNDAIVEFYGYDDGRYVSLDGPYTYTNQTEEVINAVGSLSSTRMAWKQTITWPNGSSEEEWILSRYRTRVKQY